jgi:methylenetetrahydrofolate--tRNA-(uracil-5-)-methyltransferase
VESAAIGLLAGRFAAAERRGEQLAPPPVTTAFGALLHHITGGHVSDTRETRTRSFQPMNVNFGLFPPITGSVPRSKKGARGSRSLDRKRALSARALADLEAWLAEPVSTAAE